MSRQEPSILVGPMLRWVGERDATVWVETSAECTVTVLGASSPTVTLHGRHYALVCVADLEPASHTPYEVRLDGALVWPAPGSSYPPSVIRTLGHREEVRVSFGSCRLTLRPQDVKPRWHGVCGLKAMAESGRRDESALPDLIFLAGDQVYADEVTDEIQPIVHHPSAGPRPPKNQVADFEEFARLYGVAWSEDSARWLLSTVPSVMIFDDHDVIDDWNTSAAWRRTMGDVPWWHNRIVGALGSYWIYQHLGNLAPAQLAHDELWQAVQGHDGDAGELLDAFAERADRDPESTRWSYARDLGRLRVLVLDTRAGRVLEEGKRAMLDATEWDWCAEQARGDVDHLLIGSSLPVLLPRPLSDIEGWDEALTGGAWGPRWARRGERIRQGMDFEHWPAFHRSLGALVDLLSEVAERPGGPATVAVMSGDVHYSYLAGGRTAGGARLWQIVSSPVRNPLGALLRYLNVVAFWRPIALLGRTLARRSGVQAPALDWQVEKGPWFDNGLATVSVVGREASVRWEKAVDDRGRIGLVENGSASLTG